MSGVAGVLYRDGRPGAGVDARRMVSRMGHRGPDGLDAWGSGPVGLGHAMLQTTPESLVESLPLAAGPFAITADARIDNRDVLLPQLRGTLRELGLDAATVPDSSVILASYARWGSHCVGHLLGAFAFALWDRREGHLVCARDPLGVRPLYVVDVPGRVFAFASEPKALFELDGVRPVLDERRVAESLSARLYDPVATAFEGVVRLEAAHVATATLDRTARRRYWQLDPSNEIAGTPEQSAERFAEVFEEAVRCRTRSAYPLGSELSGGLDSSAVTAVAARVMRPDQRPLHTISLAYTDPAADERPFGQAVLDRLGDAAADHYVHPERERFTDLYTEIFQTLDDFRVRGNGYGNYLTAREASRQGVRVLLTGQDGDTTVGHGWEWLQERALVGDWEAVGRQADLVFQRSQDDRDTSASQLAYERPSQIVSGHVLPVFQWWAEETRVVTLVRAARGIERDLGGSAAALLRRYWKPLVTPALVRRRLGRRAIRSVAAAQFPAVIAPSFAEATGLRVALEDQVERRSAQARGSFTVREAQLRTWASEALEGNLNKLDLYPAAVGVEARHPFMDTRLVELCLALPSGHRLRDGYTRAVMRDALRGDLPDAVLNRMNKMDHSGPQSDFLFRSDAAGVESLLQNPGRSARYLNMDALRALWERGRRAPLALDEWEASWFSAGLTLTLWFRTSPFADNS